MARLPARLLKRAIYPQMIKRVRAVAANTNVTIADELLVVDTTAGLVTLTLPAANSVPPGTCFDAVIVAGTNSAVWSPSGADQVNGLGPATGYNFLNNGVVSCRIESDGVSAWRTLFGDASASLAKTKSASAIIAIGTNTANTANLGLGPLNVGNPKIVCSIQQAAFDATLQRVQAFGNIDGSVTINGNANATAAVTVSVFVDLRA